MNSVGDALESVLAAAKVAIPIALQVAFPQLAMVGSALSILKGLSKGNLEGLLEAAIGGAGVLPGFGKIKGLTGLADIAGPLKNVLSFAQPLESLVSGKGDLKSFISDKGLWENLIGSAIGGLTSSKAPASPAKSKAFDLAGLASNIFEKIATEQASGISADIVDKVGNLTKDANILNIDIQHVLNMNPSETILPNQNKAIAQVIQSGNSQVEDTYLSRTRIRLQSSIERLSLYEEQYDTYFLGLSNLTKDMNTNLESLSLLQLRETDLVAIKAKLREGLIFDLLHHFMLEMTGLSIYVS